MGRKTEKRKAVKVLNPRYAGATPEIVARALMRPAQKGGEEAESGEPSPVIAESAVQSNT